MKGAGDNRQSQPYPIGHTVLASKGTPLPSVLGIFIYVTYCLVFICVSFVDAPPVSQLSAADGFRLRLLKPQLLSLFSLLFLATCFHFLYFHFPFSSLPCPLKVLFNFVALFPLMMNSTVSIKRSIIKQKDSDA